MKKTLIAVAAAAALTTSAFAEVTFGGFGRQIWAPVASDGKDTRTVYSTSWGTPIRFGYGMDYKSDNVDFHADFHLDEDTPKVNDQVKTTVRLADGVEVAIGKIQIDDLRGNFCFGSWDVLRAGDIILGEDLTMSRLMNEKGVAAKYTAIDNLVVVAGLPVTNGVETKEMVKAIKVGAGYTIEGVGQVKVAFNGNGSKVTSLKDGKEATNTGKLEVAFNLSSVENLNAEVGFKMDICDADWTGTVANPVSANKTIALGAGYKVSDACTVTGAAEITLIPDFEYMGVKTSFDPTIKFGAGVDYALDNGLSLSADVRVGMSDGNDTATSFMVAAKKGFSNGNIAVGFEAANKTSLTGITAQDDFVWALPIAITYYF